MRNATLALGAVLLAPTMLAAQATPVGWSRVIVPRACIPQENPCTPREGLIWQSDNTVPTYPEVMRQVGIGALVTVRFDVLPGGGVDPSSVQVTQSGNRAFEQPTIRAIQRWHFATEAPDRPEGPITLEFKLLYAGTEGCLPHSPTPSQVAWMPGGEYRELIVTSGCPIILRRDEIQPRRKG